MLNIVKAILPARNFATLQGPLYFKATPMLLAEPLKKKKRIDPMIIKQREEKRKRRIEKMIRKLERGVKQFKPLDEIELPGELENNRSAHLRRSPAISEEIKNERILLQKQWAVYKLKAHLADVQMCDRLVASQQWALDQLKLESEELYKAAIQLDENLIPFKSKGPVETPPIKNFDSPDGEYIDISKKWE